MEVNCRAASANRTMEPPDGQAPGSDQDVAFIGTSFGFEIRSGKRPLDLDMAASVDIEALLNPDETSEPHPLSIQGITVHGLDNAILSESFILILFSPKAWRCL